MKKSISILLGVSFLIGIANIGIAQNGTVASGGVANGNGGTATYSVGEVVYKTLSGNGGIVIEGLQQAYNAIDLPITLLQFSAIYTGNKTVEISWNTVSEFNNQYFTVERSKDGVGFEEINRIQGNGNSYSKQTYQATDASPLYGTSYYRLKQIDNDGTVTYSSIVSVNTSESDSEMRVNAYPNPTVSYLNLQIVNAASKNLKYAIYTMEGKLISEQKINDNLTIIGTSGLSKGSYLLKVTNRNALEKSFKIIKN